MRKAFTLMELMVAISIIAIVVAIIVPVVRMATYTRVVAAEQIVSIAGETARRFAMRDISFETDLDNATPGIQKGKYTGTAVLFTQDEARIIETDQRAADSAGNALALMSPPRYGYKDLVGRDFIPIPRGSGVVGIVRTAAGPARNATETDAEYMIRDTGLKLIAPPFAVRFNEHGGMVIADASASNIEDRYVFYDGDCDRKYNINDGRVPDFTPEPYDSTHPNFDQNNGAIFDKIDNKIIVPLERIECVVAVMVYDKSEFRDELMTLRAGAGGYIDTEARAWLMERGKALMFNRTTGRVIRND